MRTMSVGAAMVAGALLLAVGCARNTHAEAALPAWLQARVDTYQNGPEHASPTAIWRIQHQGRTAYYVAAPCCDQFNPLWDAQGEVICHPDGGFTGRGDGQCPTPKDAGTQAQLIWSDSRKPAPQGAPFVD